jgi:cell wall-associated NlpC family hydrolase
MNGTLQTAIQAFIESIQDRSYEEMDCWELVQEFHNYFEQSLPKYFDGRGKSLKEKAEAVDYFKSEFEKVQNPLLGDIVLMSIFGLPVHVGIYLEPDHILHTDKGHGVVLDTRTKWKTRIVGYYRARLIND